MFQQDFNNRDLEWFRGIPICSMHNWVILFGQMLVNMNQHHGAFRGIWLGHNGIFIPVTQIPGSKDMSPEVSLSSRQPFDFAAVSCPPAEEWHHFSCVIQFRLYISGGISGTGCVTWIKLGTFGVLVRAAYFPMIVGISFLKWHFGGCVAVYTWDDINSDANATL